ncbi:UNKNOWN [Stylonychia lemnae]|uniref:Uncharacterized protein n=1 Tax=Stylonychia lemnae TaxID=5949 RepID=A0A078AE79_STYLE|nr:UNKNOWN [Stylonychia lemnae]|eukprot:CDW80574.1 UNKNOWN [Stylonychia lemnae]
MSHLMIAQTLNYLGQISESLVEIQEIESQLDYINHDNLRSFFASRIGFRKINLQLLSRPNSACQWIQFYQKKLYEEIEKYENLTLQDDCYQKELFILLRIRVCYLTRQINLCEANNLKNEIEKILINVSIANPMIYFKTQIVDLQYRTLSLIKDEDQLNQLLEKSFNEL